MTARLHRLDRHLARWAPLIALAIVLGGIWASSYQGRVDVVQDQRKGCARANADRRSDLERDQDTAAMATKLGRQDLIVRADQRQARTRRSIVNCQTQYGSPSLIQLR